MILIGSVISADAAGTGRSPTWALSAGVLYSPSVYGADEGTLFWTGSVSRIESRWALHAEILHGRYIDYPGVGSVTFTPVGVGTRYSPLGSGPFIQLVPLFVFGNWGGSSSGINRVLPGVDATVGVLVPHLGPSSLAFEIGYLGCDGGGEVRVFDAPDYRLKGLSIVTLRIEVGLRFGK